MPDGTTVWVTRDNTKNPDYEVWWECPTFNQGWDVPNQRPWPQIGNFCIEHFERLTGIKLNPGEIMECTLSLTPKEKTDE